MLQFATILHPTDFSPAAEYAFDLACSLAKSHGSRVVVLHVAELPMADPAGAMAPSPPGGVREAISDRLLAIRAADPAVSLMYRLEEGEPAPEILRVAREIACDLIVMASHGRTGLSHLVMGSVAEKVVRNATCPVLVVKKPAPASRSPQTVFQSAVPGPPIGRRQGNSKHR